MSGHTKQVCRYVYVVVFFPTTTHYNYSYIVFKRKQERRAPTAGVSVLRAARAASRIGIASPRSLSQSSLIAWAAAACLLATASSAFTTYTQKGKGGETLLKNSRHINIKQEKHHSNLYFSPFLSWQPPLSLSQ